MRTLLIRIANACQLRMCFGDIPADASQGGLHLPIAPQAVGDDTQANGLGEGRAISGREQGCFDAT